MRIKVDVKGLLVDPVTHMPMVVLRGAEDGADYVLPIWVGVFEANAISLELEQVASPRPMTHDLLASLVDQLGGRVSEVVIGEVRDSTYYATVVLEQDGRILNVDARPSDAIALALRSGAAILVEQELIEDASAFDVNSQDPEKLRAWFEDLELTGVEELD
jgi:bifunctional DNase/RNase